MKFKEIKHHKDLGNYPRSGMYLGISGVAFILGLILTRVFESFGCTMSCFPLMIYIIWCGATIIFSEVQYLSYAAKDRIYYYRKNTFDGDIIGSISDGLFLSILYRNITALHVIVCGLAIGIVVNPYYFIVCPLVCLIPFIFVCIHTTEIKIKFWCFFKYMVIYDMAFMEMFYLIIAVGAIWWGKR